MAVESGANPAGTRGPGPFSQFEWMIAWRYLRARRTDGGVSVMTWISLIGITLAVAALIITLAVRSGFRAEFVDAILGSNAHVTVYSSTVDASGRVQRIIPNFEEVAEQIGSIPGVIRAAPLVKGQVMATTGGSNAGVEVHGIRAADLLDIERVADPANGLGEIERFADGIAIGTGVARTLGATVGDQIRLISPNGVKTAFGTSPRVSSYEIVYIFSAGRPDIDRTRVYLPFSEAQLYFDRDGVADEIEVLVENPDDINSYGPALRGIAGPQTLLWTWRDRSGAFLRALEVEDTVMFVLMSILVLIASMNIISGLVMLVKNKGRDIGILRTMGLTQGSIMRVFFLCGALVGLIGTICGVILGCLFALYFDPIFALVNGAAGGDIWDPAIRPVYRLPAQLQLGDVMSAVGLSLFLSFVVTIFPARRAARLNPVEALRYE